MLIIQSTLQLFCFKHSEIKKGDRERESDHLDTSPQYQSASMGRTVLVLSSPPTFLGPTAEQTEHQNATKTHLIDVCLFVCLGFNGTFSTNRLYCAIIVGK